MTLFHEAVKSSTEGFYGVGMANPFCACLPWVAIGKRAKAELDRYTKWLRNRERIPNERYPSEGLFRNGMILWLAEKADLEFVNVESGYVPADRTLVDISGNPRPKCDLHFALRGEEHWVEFKTGPGPGNSFYKTSEKEWIGKWSSDVKKLRHPEIPANAQRHLLSFGLARTGEDGVSSFYGRGFSRNEGEPDERFALSFIDLGEVDWKCGTHDPDQSLNRLFMTVVCVRRD